MRSFIGPMAGGIFCIENWAPDLRNRETVRPLLDYLESRGAARVVHQRVDTERELRHYLSRFASLGSYRVAYLAMHGQRGRVWVGGTQLTLDRLTLWERLDTPERDQTGGDEGPWHLDLPRKAVHLGSCSSLRVSPRRLSSFRAATGAAAICGYTRDVEWIDAGAADLMILAALAHAADGPHRSFTQALRALGHRAGTTLDALGFVSDPDWRVPPRRSTNRAAQESADPSRISDFVQAELRERGLQEATAVEAAGWLDEAGLLRDSASRPGLPLRNMLRAGLIRGAQQRPKKPHGRWHLVRQ